MSYVYALTAAALFGAAAPVSKMLLSGLPPLMLAALCYLGAGLALSAWKAALLLRASPLGEEPGLEFRDWPYMAGAILSGGILAPVLLLKGLTLTSGSGASLILNMELIFTSVIAGIFLKEYTGPRFWLAAVLVTAGAAMLSADFGNLSFTFQKGPVFIALAAFFWGVDNNLTAKISIKNPADIALIKSLAGGTANLALAALAGESVLTTASFRSALALGALSYGLSLVLIIMAMRGLGAARAGAVFGIYPFFGVFLSVLFLKEPVTFALAAASALALSGLYLVVSESHGHPHAHDGLTHEHRHTHADGHHAHEHADNPAHSGAHSHAHTHAVLRHAHPHTPDTHHTHAH